LAFRQGGPQWFEPISQTKLFSDRSCPKTSTGNRLGRFHLPSASPSLSVTPQSRALSDQSQSTLRRRCGRLYAATLLIEILLVALALAVALVAVVSAPVERYLIIAALSLAMGLQNATARRLAVPDLTTTVLTLTLTGFAADCPLAGGTNPRPGRRAIATASMFVAAIGALVLLRIGASAVLALALVLLLIALMAAAPHWRTTAAWTAP